MKVGFIGLGTMGAPMAMNIQAGGFDLVVHDVNPPAAGALMDSGATWADNPAAVASSSDVVLLSLPGPAEVAAVLTGTGGIADGAGAGLLVFDLSTNAPTEVRRLHDEMAEKGVTLLDAPVSGGPQGARSGKLAVLVGGDEAAFNRGLPVLQAMADQPIYVGPIGAGSIAKLVHNLSGYMIQTALAECFTMGVAAGLDAESMWSAIRKCALGRARTFDRMGIQYLPGKFEPPDFTLKLATKDVRLAVELGREFDVPMALAEMTLTELNAGMERGWADQDSRAPMKLQEERAGVAVRIPPERIAEIMDSE